LVLHALPRAEKSVILILEFRARAKAGRCVGPMPGAAIPRASSRHHRLAAVSMAPASSPVGEPLFARGARSGQLTDAGKLLADYAERMLNMRQEIETFALARQ